MHKLKPVYHGDHGLRTLKELVRSYLTITRDLSRVMTRVKAIETFKSPGRPQETNTPESGGSYTREMN